MKPRGLRWLFSCLALLAGCDGGRPREANVAHVDDVPITRSEVGIQLRAVLWCRGEAWNDLDEAARQARRREALDRSIEQVLLEHFAPKLPALPAAQAQASEDAFQQFLKQFESPEGWKPRLEMQGVSEVQMRDRITSEVVEGDAIENWLKAQRAQNTEQMESTARAWFDQHREKFRVPEHAKVSHIFLTGHDKEKPDRTSEIAELYRKLTAHEATFEALAAKFSEDERSKRVGGSLGWIGRDRVPADFAEKVFAQPLGKPGEPFRTQLGWHITLVEKRQPARLPEFAEVKDQIIARLDQAWRESAVKQLMEDLRAKAKVEVNEKVLEGVEPAPTEG